MGQAARGHRPGAASLAALVASLLLLVGNPTQPLAEELRVRGTVASAGDGLEAYVVTLYRTRNGPGRRAEELGHAFTDDQGAFTIGFTPPSQRRSVLYLIARRGPAALATVLGPAPVPEHVAINERTTVAAAFALAQFIRGPNIDGNAVGLRNAAGMVGNLVAVASGDVAPVLGQPPNGLATSTLRAFNSLANMVASCVRDRGACRRLFRAAGDSRQGRPRQTLQAITNIARNPWRNVDDLFSIAQLEPAPYGPALEEAPNAWTLALRFEGDGMTMNGPGAFAIDRRGKLWVTNNYQFGDRDDNVCASQLLLEFTPTGELVEGSPYEGGGVNGAGFGIGIAPNRHVWVGNFGFQAPACVGTPADSPSNSVSEFRPNGVAVSPDVIGYTEGEVSWAQGTVSDRRGNIWIANCGNDSVTMYPRGNPAAARNLGFDRIGAAQPFGVAIDHQGRAWVAGNGNSVVVAIDRRGNPVAGSPYEGPAIDQPKGIASDSEGNIWVANSGIPAAPCSEDDDTVLPGVEIGGSVTLIRADGNVAPRSPFTGGGLALPWGWAIDGKDNVWVANFGGGNEGGSLLSRISQLCGTNRANCPPGHRTGDPISPPTGYTSDALQRITGVAVDPSGNLWATDNWKFDAQQNNPGGAAIVAFLGIAAPVRTPLIGPPQSP